MIPHQRYYRTSIDPARAACVPKRNAHEGSAVLPHLRERAKLEKLPQTGVLHLLPGDAGKVASHQSDRDSLAAQA
jgi:hypothetical protein